MAGFIQLVKILLVALVIIGPIVAYALIIKLRASAAKHLVKTIANAYNLDVNVVKGTNGDYHYQLSGKLPNSGAPYTMTLRSKNYEIEGGNKHFSNSGGAVKRYEYFIDIVLDKNIPNTYILARYNLRRLLRLEYNIFSRSSRMRIGQPSDYFFECYTLDRYKPYIENILHTQFKATLEKECIKHDLIFSDKNLRIKAYGRPNLNKIRKLMIVSEKLSELATHLATQKTPSTSKNYLDDMHESLPRSFINMLYSKMLYWIVIIPGLNYITLTNYSDSFISQLLFYLVFLLTLVTLLRALFSRYFILLISWFYS